jgi:uncharacterized protein (DUF433 family)
LLLLYYANFTMESIETKQTVLQGKPVITGTRITVELIMSKLTQGATVEDIITRYPSLKAEDIYAC